MRARACAQLQKQLPDNVEFVQSDDGEAQLAGVTWFRKILSIGAPAARAAASCSGRPLTCVAQANNNTLRSFGKGLLRLWAGVRYVYYAPGSLAL